MITTLPPADEIPDLPGGAARAMMFLRAAIVGAPLSVGQGEEVPLTDAMWPAPSPPGPALTFLLGSIGLRVPPCR